MHHATGFDVYAKVAAVYSALRTLTLVLFACLALSVVGLARTTTIQEHIARKKGQKSTKWRRLTTFLGLTLLWVPLFVMLLGLPLLECDSIDREAACGAEQIANSGLTASLILGLISFGLWVGFLLDRMYLTPSAKVFGSIRGQDKALLGAAVGVGMVAFVVMVFSQPG